MIAQKTEPWRKVAASKDNRHQPMKREIIIHIPERHQRAAIAVAKVILYIMLALVAYKSVNP